MPLPQNIEELFKYITPIIPGIDPKKAIENNKDKEFKTKNAKTVIVDVKNQTAATHKEGEKYTAFIGGRPVVKDTADKKITTYNTQGIANVNVSDSKEITVFDDGSKKNSITLVNAEAHESTHANYITQVTGYALKPAFLPRVGINPNIDVIKVSNFASTNIYLAGRYKNSPISVKFNKLNQFVIAIGDKQFVLVDHNSHGTFTVTVEEIVKNENRFDDLVNVSKGSYVVSTNPKHIIFPGNNNNPHSLRILVNKANSTDVDDTFDHSQLKSGRNGIISMKLPEGKNQSFSFSFNNGPIANDFRYIVTKDDISYFTETVGSAASRKAYVTIFFSKDGLQNFVEDTDGIGDIKKLTIAKKDGVSWVEANKTTREITNINPSTSTLPTGEDADTVDIDVSSNKIYGLKIDPAKLQNLGASGFKLKFFATDKAGVNSNIGIARIIK